MQHGALLVIAALALAPAAHAKCMNRNTSALPAAGTVIPTNPLVVVELFGLDQQLLVPAAPAFVMVAGKDVVPMKVRFTHKGDFNVTQVGLQPVRELQPNTKYGLRMRGAEGKSTDVGDAAWLTGAGPDALAPTTLAAPPKVVRHEYTEYGCGPGAQVVLALPMDAVLALVDLGVADAKGAPPTRYVVPVTDGQLELGHGMCSGPFRMQDDVLYRARVRLVDGAGNGLDTAPVDVEFRGPGRTDARRPE